MNDIEERLVRDIETVVGGVVVTEVDLREARKNVAARAEGRRRRDRRLALAAVGAAAVMITVIGIAVTKVVGDDRSVEPVNPAPSKPEPSYAANAEGFLTGEPVTPEVLTGVWRVDNGTTLLRFSPSGDFSYTDAGHIYDAPAGHGAYATNGDEISIQLDTADVDGCAGRAFTMRASVPEAGIIRVAHALPGFGDCSVEPGQMWALEQILPAGPYAEFTLSDEPGTWTPLTDRSTLYGDWFSGGSRYMLELTRGGGYFVADQTSEPVDQGEWSLQGGRLTLTSSSASTECSEGDVLVWTGMEIQRDRTDAIRGTPSQNACGGAWASTTGWVLLPDSFHA